nr:hypothetical protein CFP56_33369 [Quercus suber]
MGSNKIQAIRLCQLEEPIKQICAFKAATYVDFSGFTITLSSVSRNDRSSTKSTTLFRPQSSLQKIFQDLNLGVHVECNCPQPQNVEALGLSVDNYEARSCTCLCGAQNCCRCLKEVGSTHSAGQASVHSSNLESQIISSDTDGGGSSLVILPSNSGLPMDVANGVQEIENHLIKFRRNMARHLEGIK